MLSVAYISVGVGFEFRYEYSCPSGSTRAIHSGRRSRGMPIYGFYASSQSQTELAKSGQNPPTHKGLRIIVVSKVRTTGVRVSAGSTTLLLITHTYYDPTSALHESR